jgi:hypothetical protein
MGNSAYLAKLKRDREKRIEDASVRVTSNISRHVCFIHHFIDIAPNLIAMQKDTSHNTLLYFKRSKFLPQSKSSRSSCTVGILGKCQGLGYEMFA